MICLCVQPRNSRGTLWPRAGSSESSAPSSCFYWSSSSSVLLNVVKVESTQVSCCRAHTARPGRSVFAWWSSTCVCFFVLLFHVSVKEKEEGQVDSEARPMKDDTFGEYRWDVMLNLCFYEARLWIAALHFPFCFCLHLLLTLLLNAFQIAWEVRFVASRQMWAMPANIRSTITVIKALKNNYVTIILW